MRQIMVRYKVKPERVEENAALVRAVYAELGDAQPPGFRYATFTLEDGVTFVHFAIETGDEGNPLSSVQAFSEFTADIGDRCDEPPVVTELTEVGSYKLLDR